MRVRGFKAAVAAVVVTLAAGGALVVPADATEQATFKRAVSLSASAKQVEEGDRALLTARVTSPSKAKRITLQQQVYDHYAAKNVWRDVKATGVRGRNLLKFPLVATGPNNERYRVSVAYSTGKPVVSKSVNLTVWRWIPLSDYKPYYSTYGATFGETTLNGRRYTGWGAASFSDARAWEARFTPGRHCKAFHGVLGVADISADDSSGTIAFTADDVTVYNSPVLTPGMDVPVELSLAEPYRFGIQLTNTSADGVKAWPVIGDPAFLCTGV